MEQSKSGCKIGLHVVGSEVSKTGVGGSMSPAHSNDIDVGRSGTAGSPEVAASEKQLGEVEVTNLGCHGVPRHLLPSVNASEIGCKVSAVCS